MNINIYLNMIKIKQNQWVLDRLVNNVLDQNKGCITKIIKKNINSVIKNSWKETLIIKAIIIIKIKIYN